MKPAESFISQPVRSLQTMLRTISQVDPEQLSVIPDGVYSQQTAEAVRVFQRNHKLPQTGTADPDTWDAIVAAYRPAQIEASPAEPIFITLNPGQTFRLGDRHHHITLVQAMLRLIAKSFPGFPDPELTSVFDQSTAEAIQALQLLAGLEADGILDKTTWKHLVKHHATAADRLERRRNE